MKVCFGLLLALLLAGAGLAHGAAGENGRTLAVVLKSLRNPYFTDVQAGAAQVAAGHNMPVEFFGLDRDTDIDHQIGILENLIERGYGALVLAPAHATRLVPMVRKARDQGMPVVIIDDPLSPAALREAGLALPFIGPDNEEGAYVAATYLARRLSGKGRLLYLEGGAGTENAEARKRGVLKALKNHAGITLVESRSANWQSDEAFTITSQALTQWKPLDAILCANDLMALGAARAVQAAGLTGKVLIGGYDNIESVRQEIRSGAIAVTVEQHADQIGGLAVETARRLMQGQRVDMRKITRTSLVTNELFGQRVGLVVSQLANPFFATLAKGFRHEAEEFGMIPVIVDVANDPLRQIEAMRRFLAEGVAAVVLNPVSASGALPALDLAAAAHVPVVTVDRRVDQGQVAAHVASDNMAGGRQAGVFLAKRLGQGGRVVELEGLIGTSAAHDRGQGFHEAVQSTGLKVVARESAGFDRQEARRLVARLLARGLAFEAIFAHNDAMALGACEALAAAGKKDVVVVGFDAMEEALGALGKGCLAATVSQDPELMGRLALQAVADVLRRLPVAPAVSVPVELVEP